MQIVLADKLEGISQDTGTATLTFDTPTAIRRLQIDAETTSPTGRLRVLFLSPGLSAPKPLLSEAGSPIVIDLAAPYPISVHDLSLAALVIQPEGLTADQTASVGVVREINDGALQLLNAKLLEATVEIDALNDLIQLNGGNDYHVHWLTEWRSYRLALCRLIMRGDFTAADALTKPVSRQV